MVVLAIDAIRAVLAHNHVVTVAAVKPIAFIAAKNLIVIVLAIDVVLAVLAPDDVIAISAIKPIIVISAEDLLAGVMIKAEAHDTPNLNHVAHSWIMKRGLA